MGGNVLCTSDENRGRYLSHKDVIRMLKGQSSRFIRKGHNDFRKMWDGESDPTTAIPGPTVPESLLGESPNVVDRLTYTEELKMVNSRREDFNNNLSLTWDLIWGQCTLHMRNKLMMDEGFDDALETANCVWLLKKTRHYMYSCLSEMYQVMGVLQAEKDLINLKQGRRSLSEYAEQFKEAAETTEYSNGSIGNSETLHKFVETYTNLEDEKPRKPSLPIMITRPPTMEQFQRFLTDMDEYQRKLKRFERKNREYESKVKETARNTYLGSLFVMNSDMDQYGNLLRHWETEFLGGKNMYPSSLQDAITRLENYKRTNKKKNNFKQNRSPNVSFLQSGKIVPGTDGKLHAKIDCHKCKQFGHYAPQCPSNMMSRVSPKGVQMM